MKLALALLASAGGVFATLTMLTLLLAGSPNSSPQQLAEIKAYMWATGIVGLGGLAFAIWGMTKGRHAFAAWAGAAPIAFFILLFVFLLTRES